MVICGLVTVQAADTTLTLACKGTETDKVGAGSSSSEQISIGIIVDFQKKAVLGLSGDSEPVPITRSAILKFESYQAALSSL
jgi:hypothetical protein